MKPLAQTPYHSKAKYSKVTLYPPSYSASPSPPSPTYSRETMLDTKSKKKKIHSLLYTDDLKVYAQNDKEMEKF